MKRVCVCGGRDYTNKARVFRCLDNALAILGDIELIHGDANGADKLAGEWAEIRNQKATPFPAKWKKYGKSAGPIRNREMINNGFDFLIAFPGDKGTADMIEATMKKNIPVLVIYD